MSKNALRLVDFTIKNYSPKSFSKYINTSNAKISSVDGNGISFKYQILPGLCREKPSNGNLIFSAASTLAIFDELSTYAFMTQDKNFRPGVSIHLNTEILQEIGPGNSVIVTSKAVKCGKSIGFCDMRMVNSNGELVARGRHVKYLPMGLIWDILTHPNVFPHAIDLIEAYEHREDNTLIRKLLKKFVAGREPAKNSESTVDIDFEKVASLFRCLKIKDFHSEFLSCPSPQASEVLSPTNVISRLFELQADSFMNNHLGRLHGGALAISCEEAAMKAAPGNTATILIIILKI